MQKALLRQSFFVSQGGSISKNSAGAFAFGENYGMIQLLDKLEFVDEYCPPNWR